MKTALYLGALLLVGFWGCQKEPDSDLLQNQLNCSLESIVYHDDAGNPIDTCTLTFTGSQVTRADYSEAYFTLEYTNGKVTKRNTFIQGTTIPIFYDVFTYNADGSFNKIESWFTGLGVPLLYYTYDFTYSGGKLQQILEMQDTTITGGNLHPVYKYTYTWTGENITQIDEEDIPNATVEVYQFQYDSKPNYFKNLPGVFFYDYLFLDLDSSYLPYFLSGNNVTKELSSYGNSDFAYTEENGNIKVLSWDGVKFAQYNFHCQ